jgi:hypothetical protein
MRRPRPDEGNPFLARRMETPMGNGPGILGMGTEDRVDRLRTDTDLAGRRDTIERIHRGTTIDRRRRGTIAEIVRAMDAEILRVRTVENRLGTRAVMVDLATAITTLLAKAMTVGGRPVTGIVRLHHRAMAMDRPLKLGTIRDLLAAMVAVGTGRAEVRRGTTELAMAETAMRRMDDARLAS